MLKGLCAVIVFIFIILAQLEIALAVVDGISVKNDDRPEVTLLLFAKKKLSTPELTVSCFQWSGADEWRRRWCDEHSE